MKFYFSNNIIVENPTTEFIQWCKKDLTIANPDYNKKLRMGFWLGDTPRTICLYEVRGKNLILPYGIQDLIPDEIVQKVEGGAYLFNEQKKIDYDADIHLRDYQKKAVNNMLITGHGILQAPAGSGKTRCGIALFTKLKSKTLWLCHTKDLINQAKKAAEEFIDKSLIGTITEGKVNIGKGVTFATVQTMCKLDLPQYKDLWELILSDEAHRISGSPTRITQYQKVLSNLSARHKFGLSATVHRSDGLEQCIFALIGKVAYKVPEEAVSENIMKVGIKSINTNIILDRKALNTDGTLNYTKLIDYLINNQERQKTIVNNVIKNKGRSCLILSSRLGQLKDLIDLLPEDMKTDAVMIHGKMVSKENKKKREQAIEDMRKGKKKYLFATYALAKEGLDIPKLERLFFGSPQKDYAVITQSIGRIARLTKGKENAIVYDFIDNIGYLIRSYKKRCSTYRKNRCYFIEEGKNE